jgi:hypothetical protein
MTNMFEREVEEKVWSMLMELGLSLAEAKTVDWRKARDKCYEERGECTIMSIKPYLAVAAGRARH